MLQDKLTKIGEITLPVYALGLRGAPNLAKFNFLRLADCMAEVTDEDDKNKIGSIGGVIGAHYLAHINRDSHSEPEAELIIDVAEAWEAFTQLLDSENTQPIIERLRIECTEKFERECNESREEADRKKREELLAELHKLETEEKDLTNADT